MQSYIKAKKNHLNIFGVLKIIAFLSILSYLTYRLYIIEDIDGYNIGITHNWPLIIALCLVPLNWYFEYQKWKKTTNILETSLSKKEIQNSFLAGMITGLITPNMIGNFIGRLYYFERKDRVLVTVLTLVSNQSQFIVTLILGALGLIAMPLGEAHIQDNALLWGVIGLSALLAIVIYFNLERILLLFGKTKKLGGRLAMTLSSAPGFRWQVLVISLLRYSVFISQFVLVLIAFGVDFDVQLIIRIAQVYLISALIPTLILGKVGVRESVGIFILSSLGIAELTILVSSLSVWLINLIIPTLIATILVKRNT